MLSSHAPTRPRYDVNVVALLTNSFCSVAATLTGTIALGLQVFDITGRELDLGLLGLAEFLPAFLLVLVTGSVADRYDRRRVAAGAGVLAASFAFALAWYASTEPTAVAPIFLFVVGFGVARAFLNPAARALPADVVPHEHYPWLVARLSFAMQAAFIIGPPLGGFLYARHPVAPYLAMGALLLVAATAISVVQLRVVERASAATTPREMAREALSGLRFIRRQPVLLGAISLDLFAVLFGGAVALLPALAKERLGVGAVATGWLRAAGGVGSLVVTLFLLRRPVSRRVGRRLLVSIALFGVFTIVLGVTTSFAIAFVSMAALTGADAVSVFIRSTLLPLVTPAQVRGRVVAVEMVFIGASNELGAFESGVAAALFGTPGAIVLGGAATMVIALAWWRLFPALRDVDRFPSYTG